MSAICNGDSYEARWHGLIWIQSQIELTLRTGAGVGGICLWRSVFSSLVHPLINDAQPIIYVDLSVLQL